MIEILETILFMGWDTHEVDLVQVVKWIALHT